MRVYKFLDAKYGMKSLAEKRLKISTVEDLNDPFELLPFGMTDKTKRMALNLARKTWAKTRDPPPRRLNAAPKRVSSAPPK